MDPYSTLGIPHDVSESDLKKAYRKEAMKWHPDRAGDSAEANSRFQQACQAYREISKQFEHRRRGKSAHSEQNYNGMHEDPDEVFDEVILEYAISLARAGYTEEGIRSRLDEIDCEESAEAIAARALRFEKDLNETSRLRQGRERSKLSLAAKRFDYATVQALLGHDNPDAKSRQRISDYLEALNNLQPDSQASGLKSGSKNRYLSKVFNRAILLFVLIAATIYLLPKLVIASEFGLIDYFQLPSIVLSLMLVWSAYHRLWLLSAIGMLLMGFVQYIYYRSMPWAIEQDYTTLLLLAALCYLPFLVTRSEHHHHPLRHRPARRHHRARHRARRQPAGSR